jgi:hypothetical protein
VDAFAPVPFAGNPAAVCLLATGLPDALRQSIAEENNLSETAFIELLDAEGRGDGTGSSVGASHRVRAPPAWLCGSAPAATEQEIHCHYCTGGPRRFPARRHLPPALVHAGSRGAAVRPRDARRCARALQR